MSLQSQILQRLDSIIQWMNDVIANSKQNHEHDPLDPFDRSAILRAELAQISKRFTLQDFIDDIANEFIRGNVPGKFRNITIDHITPGSTKGKMITAMNLMANYPIEEGAFYFFTNRRIVLSNGGVGLVTDPTGNTYAVITEIFVLAQKILPDLSGNSSIGIGGTTVLPNGIYYLTTNDNRSLEPTTHELGDIGVADINDFVDTDTNGPYPTPNEATILFNATQGGTDKSWLFMGVQEEVGIGNPASAITDYMLFPSDGSTDPNPDYPETLPQSNSNDVASTLFRMDNHECIFYFMDGGYYQPSFKTRFLKLGGYIRALIDTSSESDFPVIENKWWISIPDSTVEPTGTATVTIGVDTYLMTYNLNIQTTLDDFVALHTAGILTNNALSIFVNENNQLELDGTASPVITIANTSGTLDGNVKTIPAVLIDSPDFEANELFDMFTEYDGIQLNTFFIKR